MQHLSIPMTNLGFNYNLEIESWKSGFSGFRVFSNGQREPLEGGLGIGLDMLMSLNMSQQWKHQIPRDLYDITVRYPEYQYQMLWLASNYTEAQDLLKSRPIILALICREFKLNTKQAANLVQQGQRCILNSLGLDGTKSALKFIDKIEQCEKLCVNLRLVSALLNVHEARYKRFKHYTTITYPTIILDNNHPFLTGTRLGQALAHESANRHASLSAYVSDTLRLGEHQGIADPISLVERLDSIESLRELHDRWVDRRNEIQADLTKPKDTDKPYTLLFPSNNKIQQIVNYEELVEEAQKQKHCIDVYHNRIIAQHYYVFKMTQPERMTIGIRKVEKKQFPYEIDQVAGYRNKIPSEETRTLIYHWLESNRKIYLNSANLD